MEAVAAVASIAGIITVVAQSIDGLIKFSDFLTDLSAASKTINRLLSDIESLIQVLRNIGDVLEQAEARRPDQNFASLDVKLEDCAKDVHIWLATARVLDPASNGGGKAWLKKVRLAVNNTAIKTIREEIGRHKQTLCLSLAVFGRTIDIDTSERVHQIGGQFDEALSASLSVRSVHEEVLRRIEHYSMTSMHSSAHSIRSMDSMRTELSRLEAMITSASVPHLPETETGKPRSKPGSSLIEGQTSTPVDGGNRVPRLSIPDSSPTNKRESSTTGESDIELTPRHDSSNGSRKGLDRRSQSQRRKQRTVERCGQPDYHVQSAKYHSILDKSTNINLSVASPAEEGNKSSFLYAEYSKDSWPRQHERPGVKVDTGAINRMLRESLASIYPPEVVDYISLRQMTTLCEDHVDLVDQRPSVQISKKGKMRKSNPAGRASPTSAGPVTVSVKYRLIELRNAIKICREQCIEAGYSLSELEKLLFQSGYGRHGSANRQPPVPEPVDGHDSSSVYSEDFHSTTE